MYNRTFKLEAGISIPNNSLYLKEWKNLEKFQKKKLT